jgi:ankyrin repeat protein
MECKDVSHSGRLTSLMFSPRFRWVFCQLEVLRHSFPTNLRRILDELPKSLDETYERILKKINNSNREHAYRLLQCLAVAIRPLQVEELAEVLAVDFHAGGIPKLNANWRWEDQEEAVLSACSSLVSVTIDYGSRIVQFSHFSVKEFLTSDRLVNSVEEMSQFYIPIEPSHVILAQACLGVLLRLDHHTIGDNLKGIPLVWYAAHYWYQHAQIGNVEFHLKDAMCYFFDTDNPHFSAWVRIQRPYSLLRRSLSQYEMLEKPSLSAPLYFAAECGFHGVVEHLINKHPQQVNQLGGLYGTPFHASVFEGHFGVAQFLFAHGANINSHSEDNQTPLHIASQRRHLEIGKWLLKCGADVNSQGADGATPLHYAAENGHLEATRILLERNADVNGRDENGFTPFLRASESGNPDVLLLLLDHNADEFVRDNKGRTPLHCAAGNGHLEAARMLLKRNAEVNARDDDGFTPFLRASRNGKPDVLRLLLDHNADKNVRNNNGSTALHCAAGGGHLEVALILLGRGAEVDSRNHLEFTHPCASTNGHTKAAFGYDNTVFLFHIIA